MHLLLISSILEARRSAYYRVTIFFFYGMMEDEKGFIDLRVVWFSRLAGLMRMLLPFEGNRLLPPSDERYSPSLVIPKIKLC